MIRNRQSQIYRKYDRSKYSPCRSLLPANSQRCRRWRAANPRYRGAKTRIRTSRRGSGWPPAPQPCFEHIDHLTVIWRTFTKLAHRTQGLSDDPCLFVFLSLSFFRVSLVTFLRAFAVAHARTRTHKKKQKPPFANTFHTAPRDRTALYLFSFFFFSSSFLSFCRFTNLLLPTVHQRWTVAMISERYVERNATPALFVIPPRKRAHFVPVPARTAAASR